MIAFRIACLYILLAGLLAAQISGASAKPPTERAKKKQQARQGEELHSPYSKWLTVDVGYIITDEERAAFQKLNNDEEREQFVEAFWLRRDPTPDTDENEFKEEHYRRFAYANEHFSSGIPGWRSDRGRVYIVHGPPDEREEHASGGAYTRPTEEGGGTTSTFPFEEWRYRHIDGVGDNVKIEFVDTTMSGEFRLTIDPSEKDALLYVPNAGLTDAEAMGLSTKTARFNRTDGTHLGASLFGQPESMNEFTRIEQLANLMKPPANATPDFAFVGSSIRYNVLPMKARVNYFPVTAASVFTYITVQFDNRDLQFVSRDGSQRASVNIAGYVSTLTHSRVASFDETVVVDTPGPMLDAAIERKSIYSKRLALAPGAYRLTILAKDAVGGNVCAYEQALVVPSIGIEGVAVSSIVLADAIETLPTKSIGAGQFAIGDTKVRPRVDAVFHSGERMEIYFKLYDFGADAGGAAGAREIVLEVVRSGQSLARQTSETGAAAETTVRKSFDLTGFAPAAYTLRVTITDRVTGKSVTRSVPFTIS
jgi:GWxTD domain-containing protein